MTRARRHFSKLTSMVQFILVATIVNARVAYVCSSITTPELTNADGSTGTGLSSSSGLDEKRSWNSLQGSWGKKRSGAAGAVANEDTDNWIPLLLSNGEHQSTIGATNPPQQRDLALVYLVNAASLERLARERQQLAAENENYLESDDEDVDFGDESGNGGILNEKRAWKNLNAAWGKRRNAPAWNKFSGAWGKREPSWNNLKGMWGKRSNWQKLHGGWGKRSVAGAESLSEFN